MIFEIYFLFYAVRVKVSGISIEKENDGRRKRLIWRVVGLDDIWDSIVMFLKYLIEI